MNGNERQARFKYETVFEALHEIVTDIGAGDGDRLPTEMELARKFGVSRPTVTRALNELQKRGLITRRVGSGSYISRSTPNVEQTNRLFGLVIPRLGSGEIFEPICARIAARAEQHDFSLLWSGSHVATEEAAAELVDVVRRYIENNVAGVFFEPLELTPSFDTINRRLIAMLTDAHIPVVLIDSDYVPYPERSAFDLVGIDNFRAGFVVTEHAVRNGASRVDFFARPFSAYTVSIRLLGYQAALLRYGIAPQQEWVHFGHPEDDAFLKGEIIDGGARAIICSNDETAAALMPRLESLGVHIPEDIQIVGFDDIRYANLLRVPLTTYHQPVTAIGDLALATMLERLAHPDLPPRTITLKGELIVRESCGARCGTTEG